MIFELFHPPFVLFLRLKRVDDEFARNRAVLASQSMLFVLSYRSDGYAPLDDTFRVDLEDRKTVGFFLFCFNLIVI
mgnify:CR=1 FL=1